MRPLLCFLACLMTFLSVAQNDKSANKKVAIYVIGDKQFQNSYRKVLASQLVKAVRNTHEYIPIERTNEFIDVLTGMNDYEQQHVKQNEIVAREQQLGAEYVLIADVTNLGDRYYIDGRIVHVGTSEIVVVEDVSGPVSNSSQIIELARSLGEKLLKGSLTTPESKTQISSTKDTGEYTGADLPDWFDPSIMKALVLPHDQLIVVYTQLQSQSFWDKDSEKKGFTVPGIAGSWNKALNWTTQAEFDAIKKSGLRIPYGGLFAGNGGGSSYDSSETTTLYRGNTRINTLYIPNKGESKLIYVYTANGREGVSLDYSEKGTKIAWDKVKVDREDTRYKKFYYYPFRILKKENGAWKVTAHYEEPSKDKNRENAIGKPWAYATKDTCKINYKEVKVTVAPTK